MAHVHNTYTLSCKELITHANFKLSILQHTIGIILQKRLTFSGQSALIGRLKGVVVVAKVGRFVHSGI